MIVAGRSSHFCPQCQPLPRVRQAKAKKSKGKKSKDKKSKDKKSKKVTS